MKRLFVISLILSSSLLFSNCDKPDVLKREAKLKIENTSTSNYITGVYFSTVGYGTNRMDKIIGPGESITFTLDIEDDSVYDIKVTSDLVGYETLTRDHYDFSWDETYIIELTADGWYTD